MNRNRKFLRFDEKIRRSLHNRSINPQLTDSQLADSQLADSQLTHALALLFLDFFRFKNRKVSRKSINRFRSDRSPRGKRPVAQGRATGRPGTILNSETPRISHRFRFLLFESDRDLRGQNKADRGLRGRRKADRGTIRPPDGHQSRS